MMPSNHRTATLAAIMALLGAEESPNQQAARDRSDGNYPAGADAARRDRMDAERRRHYAAKQTERDAAAAELQAERRRRKAENFAKRQPKGAKP